jgi:hypothetical protein
MYDELQNLHNALNVERCYHIFQGCPAYWTGKELINIHTLLFKSYTSCHEITVYKVFIMIYEMLQNLTLQALNFLLVCMTNCKISIMHYLDIVCIHKFNYVYAVQYDTALWL